MNLQLSAATWLSFAGAAILWITSGLLAARRLGRHERGWRVLPLSLFGFAWAAFGAVFVARFLVLASDPTLFRASRFPPWLIPASALTHTWVCLALYWCLFSIGAFGAARLSPSRLGRLARRFDLLGEVCNVGALDVAACISLAATLVMALAELPAGFATPVGHLRMLWALPATLGWHMHFQGKLPGLRRYLYLAPGLVLFSASPYREHLLTLFLCVSLPAVQLRPRFGAVRLAAVAVGVLLVSSVILYVYRPIKWEGQPLSESRQQARWDTWMREPRMAPWTRISARFHGFDSAALTVWLVPETFPFEERRLGTELLVSAFLPRALYANKAFVQRARLFSTSIWAYDEGGGTEAEGSAMIAPSMLGDLWAAGGAGMVALGALCWGVLVGLAEGWRRMLSPAVGVAFTVLFALCVAGGVERDFVHASATILQLAIVCLVAVAFLPLRTAPAQHAVKGSRRSPAPPAEWRPAAGTEP